GLLLDDDAREGHRHAVAPDQRSTRTASDLIFLMRVRVPMAMFVAVRTTMPMGMVVQPVPVIVVVHQLFRHVGEHLVRRERAAARPLDAALLPKELMHD